MISLIYVSMASNAMRPDSVTEIAERAARKNALVGVTGLLAFNSARFMQLLEGDESAVLDIMQRIKLDDRHHDISILRQSGLVKRECPDWSMRVLHSPLAGPGSASDFANSLPPEMQVDTRILFTSFASSLRD